MVSDELVGGRVCHFTGLHAKDLLGSLYTGVDRILNHASAIN